ncbi:uncharacterized protein MYCFIDRAFT_180359 [Pseudocercospora fijiensis CIRAD86]|uniref:Uncharacterized protein n=1 Tax=Pseudocercospora fijiensis (strain CIRAD86) TaxID=383855 RepID=M3AIJ5_PSEFD|nr:uncharacterized protein MYCFIDRAFT_180359 [Pseudocercospora fijiensis CIRAD86]EME77028.1 hypothetical protein MYCFIDRAFT_180359 [Pseudocercospora fijiensis CIRAD86]
MLPVGGEHQERYFVAHIGSREKLTLGVGVDSVCAQSTAYILQAAAFEAVRPEDARRRGDQAHSERRLMMRCDAMRCDISMQGSAGQPSMRGGRDFSASSRRLVGDSSDFDWVSETAEFQQLRVPCHSLFTARKRQHEATFNASPLSYDGAATCTPGHHEKEADVLSGRTWRIGLQYEVQHDYDAMYIDHVIKNGARRCKPKATDPPAPKRSKKRVEKAHIHERTPPTLQVAQQPPFAIPGGSAAFSTLFPSLTPAEGNHRYLMPPPTAPANMRLRVRHRSQAACLMHRRPPICINVTELCTNCKHLGFRHTAILLASFSFSVTRPVSISRVVKMHQIPYPSGNHDSATVRPRFFEGHASSKVTLPPWSRFFHGHASSMVTLLPWSRFFQGHALRFFHGHAPHASLEGQGYKMCDVSTHVSSTGQWPSLSGPASLSFKPYPRDDYSKLLLRQRPDPRQRREMKLKIVLDVRSDNDIYKSTLHPRRPQYFQDLDGESQPNDIDEEGNNQGLQRWLHSDEEHTYRSSRDCAQGAALALLQDLKCRFNAADNANEEMCSKRRLVILGSIVAELRNNPFTIQNVSNVTRYLVYGTILLQYPFKVSEGHQMANLRSDANTT